MKKPMRNGDDDYLWDLSGEPDPEIQELEQLLSTLRYQPRQLEIPEGLQPGRRRFALRDFKPLVAIAAAIALIVLGAGLWLNLERRGTSGVAKTDPKPSPSESSEQAAATFPEDVTGEVPNAGNNGGNKTVGVLVKRPNTTHRHRLNQTMAANANRRRRLEPKTPELDANELREAEAGKAQLMLALRVASAKFNLALKKAQGTNTPNQIHNQHKVG